MLIVISGVQTEGALLIALKSELDCTDTCVFFLDNKKTSDWLAFARIFWLAFVGICRDLRWHLK